MKTGSPASRDRHQKICFALALWNGRDPILKERLFGLPATRETTARTVKECYFYLDSTPTHSYMKYLYKYPQAAFPYQQLVEENRSRGRGAREFELIDTGVFNENRYFDVFVEYAKAAARRHTDPDQRRESRSGGGRVAPPADDLVPQHLVVGPRRAPAQAARNQCESRSSSTSRSTASVGCDCEGLRASVYGERDQRVETVWV